MKRKIGLFVLALALTGVLAACGNNNASANPTPTAPAVAPTDSAEPSGTPVPRASDNVVGKADNAMRNAGNAARNAVDDMGDAARGAMEGLEDAARGSGYNYNWGADNVPGTYNGYGWDPDGSVMENGTYYSYNVR